MDKETYLRRFSRMARWGLKKSEAAEAIDDYTQLLSQRGEESEGTLERELGSPAHAARLLVEPGSYHRWLAVFGGMLCCLLLAEFLLLWGSFRQYPFLPMLILLILGSGAALLWFRRREEGEEHKLPHGLVPALAVVLLAFAGACVMLWMLASGVWQSLPAPYYGLTARWALRIAGTVGAAAGILGLVKARTTHRRWRAVYILGLTSVAACVLVGAILTSMSLDTAAPNWWVSYALRLGAVGAVGLTATGVSLC